MVDVVMARHQALELLALGAVPMGARIHVVCALVVFFFQAEDGIRDVAVTGVQTCALPISSTDGGPVQALICHNAGGARHLIERGARLTLPAALCLERWDDVERLAPEASATDKQVALGLAALNGKSGALARLLPLGVDLNAFTSGFYTHATPLHHAVWS